MFCQSFSKAWANLLSWKRFCGTQSYLDRTGIINCQCNVPSKAKFGIICVFFSFQFFNLHFDNLKHDHLSIQGIKSNPGPSSIFCLIFIIRYKKGILNKVVCYQFSTTLFNYVRLFLATKSKKALLFVKDAFMHSLK